MSKASLESSADKIVESARDYVVRYVAPLVAIVRDLEAAKREMEVANAALVARVNSLEHAKSALTKELAALREELRERV